MNRRVTSLAVVTMLLGLSVHCGSRLSKAVLAADYGAAKRGIAEGQKVDELDKWGCTPLLWAVYQRNKPMVELLLENGANPNVACTKEPGFSLPSGVTPLIVASYYGLPDIVEMLMKRGGDPTIKDDRGQDSLYYAKYYRFDAVVALLSKNYPKPETRK